METEKKGRGRPRKYPIDEVKEKRPRGRPKKEVDPSLVVEKRPRGRPRKEIDPSIVVEKRPRGRPRKDGSLPINENKEKRQEEKLTFQNLQQNTATISTETEILSQKLEFLDLTENDEIIEPEYTNDKVEEAEIIQNQEQEQQPIAGSELISQTNENELEAQNDITPVDIDEAVDFMNFDISDADLDNEDTPKRKALELKTALLNKKKILPAKKLKSEDVSPKEPIQENISINKPKIETKPNISKSHLPVKEEDLEFKPKPIQKTTYSANSKVVVITGATSGMGLQMAKNLTALGQVVIAVGKRPSLCRDARNEILAEYPEGKLHFLVADLSLMGQVRILADEIKDKLVEIGRDAVDVLIHNAAVNTNINKITYENNESMWATNYLSVFLLTQLLQPLLDRSKDARVITVTNSKTYKTKLDWEDIRGVTKKSNEAVYNQTKLADLMFAIEYDHRFSSRNDLHAYCVDPGIVSTDHDIKNMSGFKAWQFRRLKQKGKTIEQGIETTMYLVLAEKLPKNVVFYANKKPAEPSKYALDPRNRSALWRYSELALKNN